jgi:hypothetical protein
MLPGMVISDVSEELAISTFMAEQKNFLNYPEYEAAFCETSITNYQSTQVLRP